MDRLAHRVLLALAWSFASAALAAGDPLDGLQFSGTSGAKGKGAHHDDAIAFRDGIFRAQGCEKMGFAPAPYDVEVQGTGHRFTATMKSPDRGEIAWSGTIDGDTAKASFRWTHKRWYGTIERDYWFDGKRAEPSPERR